MRHFVKWMAVVIVVGAVALVNVKVVLDANRTNDLVETTLVTFSEDTGGGQESNNHGSGKFFYEHRRGHPEDCTIFRYYSLSGTFFDTTKEDPNLEASFRKIVIKGIYELCPDEGNGCTVYSCQQVP